MNADEQPVPRPSKVAVSPFDAGADADSDDFTLTEGAHPARRPHRRHDRLVVLPETSRAPVRRLPPGEQITTPARHHHCVADVDDLA